MGRPKHSKQYKSAGPLRRFLFYIFGNQAFEPDFDQALEYFDAIAFARGAYTCLERPWDKNDLTEPLRRMHERMQCDEIGSVDGFSKTQKVGEIFSDIIKSISTPQMQKRLRIHRTHLQFDADRGRPPTFNELRFWSWYCESDEGKKHFGGHFIEGPLREIYRAWQKNKRLSGTFMDRGQFTRTVKEMKLSLFDGPELARFRKGYESLERRLNRKPSDAEFISEIEQKLPNYLPVLSERPLEELVDYLSNPTAPCQYAKWTGFVKTITSLDEFMRAHELPSGKRKRVISLVSCLCALDMALETDQLAPLFDGIPEYDHTPILRRTINTLQSRLQEYPTLSRFLVLTEVPTLNEIARELKLPRHQIRQLLALGKALKDDASSGTPTTIARLTSSLEEIRHLVLAAAEHYRYRTTGLLWYEFSGDWDRVVTNT